MRIDELRRRALEWDFESGMRAEVKAQIAKAKARVVFYRAVLRWSLALAVAGVGTVTLLSVFIWYTLAEREWVSWSLVCATLALTVIRTWAFRGWHDAQFEAWRLEDTSRVDQILGGVVNSSPWARDNPHPNSARARGYHTSNEIREIARREGYEPAITGCALVEQHKKIVRECRRVQRVEKVCTWTLHANTLAGCALIAWALYFHDVPLPYGGLMAMICLIFLAAKGTRGRARVCRASLLLRRSAV